MTEDQVVASCERIAEYDQSTLSCIDYLLATSDYVDFVDLMCDYKQSKSWSAAGTDDFLSNLLEQKFTPPQ